MSPPVLMHIVLIKAKPGLSAKDIDSFVNGYLDLKKTCKRNGKHYILETTGGFGNSKEGEMEGYTHGFVSKFATVEDRDHYVSNEPTKVAYVEKHEAMWDGIIVFDYTPGENHE